MIPSLNGGLYIFDGENIKAVPVSTDQLLRSSFRYSEDVVFSGGKETRSYGVSSKTGKILYQCNLNGCTNNTEGDTFMEHDVLIVQRFQQTVRAVEPRTGHEKWNFSVGQYDIELIPRQNHDCNTDYNRIANDIEIKVIVPEGLVWAINKTNPNVKLWQHKFDSPIVSIWREGFTDNNQGRLKSVNLFDNTIFGSSSRFISSPSIYVGMHNRQLYIQENSDKLNSIDHNRKSTKGQIFPWRPHPATDTALTVIETSPTTTALSILYNTEYVNGNGFYLHTKEHYEESHQCNESEKKIIITRVGGGASSSGYDEINEETLRLYVQKLMWYWHKEIGVFLLTLAVVYIVRQWLYETKDAVLPSLIVEEYPIDEKKEDTSLNQNNNSDFKSRYLTDFEPIDCLGKGGYGVVFEAKNKIDDCMYAIKRIALPNSQNSRDRVMREVKALAKLDHHNIVRYFNAWLECPPAGWQETHDEMYISIHKFSPSEFPSDVTTSTKPNESVCIDVPSSNKSSVDSASEAVQLDRVNDDDSFIVFETSGSGRSDTDDELNTSNNTKSDNLSFSHKKSRTNSNNDNSDSIVFQNTKSSGNIHDDSNVVVFCNTTKSLDDDDDKSESIVFENITKNLDKSERDKRKASFSLDLNKKITSKKSPKMLLYIQMQLCQRLSLRDWLKKQSSTTRDIKKVTNIFQQIVDAVEYVHLQGLIHRDLKPSNIFFALDEKIKIGDFGLVTAMTEGYDEPRTPNDHDYSYNEKTGIHTEGVGTHLYMSPEQSNGQSYNYKVDIYSLGIILFELLNSFSTEMERVAALLNLKKSIFPSGFEQNYPNEVIHIFFF